jgi:predicted 3-demethylubiquinone-9 3-methyltransferase (glyoxalase superfamily)
MDEHKIVPCIWLSADGGKLSGILSYYQNVFEHDFHAGHIIPLGQTPSGHAEVCEVSIYGEKYSWMCTQNEHQPCNDSVSFMIRCENQSEIDRFWNYFTREGEASQCGWCMDKYGLRWQIIPKNLGELMRKSNAMDVMMKQKKIIIEEYLN